MKSLQTLNKNSVMVRMAVMKCYDAYFRLSWGYFLGFFFLALSGLRKVFSLRIPDEWAFCSFFQEWSHSEERWSLWCGKGLVIQAATLGGMCPCSLWEVRGWKVCGDDKSLRLTAGKCRGRGQNPLPFQHHVNLKSPGGCWAWSVESALHEEAGESSFSSRNVRKRCPCPW